MRNLKRALSLALATLMVVSMMVVGAGAVSYDELTDKDKIVNQEAVQMLVELGVIDGKEDGSYDPSGIITRAEMSKLICVVLNGGNDPQLGETPVVSYTDTVGTWAAPYIEYCTTLGIVAGKGGGKFDPSATVTGSEAAKMLLVALGYNADFESMVGANWEVATNVLANKNSLYKGLNITTSEGLTRDSAAQMVYNALNAKMVEYDYSVIPSNGSVSAIAKANPYEDDRTLLSAEFNAVKVEGIVIANEVSNLNASSSALDAGKTKIQVTNSEDQKEFTGTPVFTTSTGMDQLGRSVILYVKKNNNATKAQVLGSVITSDDNKVVVDYTKDSIKDVADDNNMDVVSSTQVATNYGGLENYSKFTDPKKAGVEKILIDNDDDGEVEIVLVNTYVFGKVTTYTTSGDGNIGVSAGKKSLTADDKDDVVGFDDVAKNDYVMAIEIGGNLYVEKAETVTGALEAYKGTNPTTKLTVDGTDYNVSAVDGYTGGADNIRAAKDYGKDNLDNEATFYLDKGGYIVAMGDVTENAYNYALVLAEGTSIDERVKVALPDGTTGTYDLNSSGTGLKLKDIDVGGVYAYSINSNKQIKLTNPAAGGTSYSNAAFSKGKTTVSASGMSDAYATKNTVFFYTEGKSGDPAVIDEVNVYTGYDKAPSLKTDAKATVEVYKNGTNSSARVVAVVFTGKNLTTTNVSDTLYISSVGTSTSSYTNATAFIAGKSEPTSIKVDGSASKGAYLYTINSDGYYELESVPSTNLMKPDGDGDNQYTVYASNSDTFVTEKADGTKLELEVTAKTLLVDDSAYLSDPIAELGAGPDENDELSYVVYNNDKEAILVVVKNPETTKPDGGDENVDGVKLTGNATQAKIDAAFEDGKNVIITGNYKPSYDINVPDGKTLKVEGNFEPSGTLDNVGKIVVEGTFTYDSTDDLVGEVVAENLTVKDSAAVTGDVTVNKDLTVASGKTLTVEGTLTVKGNVSGDVKVLSTNSLYVTGNVTGKLAVGEGTDAGKAEITGNVTGDVTIGKKSTLTVKGDLKGSVTIGEDSTLTVRGKMTASSVSGASGAEIVFGGSAEVAGDAASSFVNGKGIVVTDVAGKTFTYDTDKFVNEDAVVVSMETKILFIDSRSSFEYAREQGMPESFGDWTDGIADMPWILIKMTPATGISDEVAAPAVASFKFDVDGKSVDAHFVKADGKITKQSDGCYYFALLLKTPAEEAQAGQDYLKQEDVVEGEYTVSYSFNEETLEMSATYTASK